MPTTNAGTMTATRGVANLNPDGSMTVIMYYTNTSTGRAITTRVIRLPAQQTSPITDDGGVQLAAQVPAALFNAISTLITQLDSAISTAASGAKLDL